MLVSRVVRENNQKLKFDNIAPTVCVMRGDVAALVVIKAVLQA